MAVFPSCSNKKSDNRAVEQVSMGEPYVVPEPVPLPDTPSVSEEQPEVPDDQIEDTSSTEQTSCDKATLSITGAVTTDSVPRLTPLLGMCTTCVSLNLSHSGISEIPPEIGMLTNLKYLDLSSNRIPSLPPEITRLKSLWQLNVSNNVLDEALMTKEVIGWLDNIEPRWRCGQRAVPSYNPHGFCNYAVGVGPYDYEGQVHCTGTPDTTPVIFTGDTGNILFYEHEGPPSGSYFVMSVHGSDCRLDPITVFEHEDSVLFNCPPVQMARILHMNWKPDMLLMIRGIANLHAGPLKTWYINKNAAALMTDDDYEYTEKTKDVYHIEMPEIGKLTLTNARWNNCEYLWQWRVRFGDEAWRNIPVIENDFEDRPMQRGKQCLLWVGDLDGDTAPDLLLNPAIEDYGAISIQLFLSSQYVPGTVWMPAAAYYYTRPGTSEASGC